MYSVHNVQCAQCTVSTMYSVHNVQCPQYSPSPCQRERRLPRARPCGCQGSRWRGRGSCRCLAHRWCTCLLPISVSPPLMCVGGQGGQQSLLSRAKLLGVAGPTAGFWVPASPSGAVEPHPAVQAGRQAISLSSPKGHNRWRAQPHSPRCLGRQGNVTTVHGRVFSKS